MNTINLNKGWTLNALGESTTRKIDIPFDAMLLDERRADAATGKNESWFVPKDYVYKKSFKVGESFKDFVFYLDFEGIYREAKVLLNGKEVKVLPYGYSESIVDVTELIKVSGNNSLEVTAYNSKQPNSRWYSGTGILRPVSLICLPKEHIVLNSIKITTLDIKKKEVEIQLETTSKGVVSLTVLNKDKEIEVFEFKCNKSLKTKIKLPKCELWSLENPKLYDFKFTFEEDIQTIRTGIRSIEVGDKGFLLNGERVILKGACNHSDAQTLGAITSPFIERRKIKLLKNVGYNAIRSAHNPICKYMLEAADEMGMLIMDEYVDCWYFLKTLYDYTKILKDNWKDDLKSMVLKDRNHPCVIMYSLGNEVGETAQQQGIDLLKEFISYVKTFDSTRPFTCGVNIVFNGMVKMGFGFYDESKAKKELENNSKKKKKVGSEFFNDLTNYFGGRILKQGANLPVCDRATKGAFEVLDVAGYNYGIKRYKHDLRKYKNRILCGSETFCSDAREFMLLAKENPRLIGDFVWSGLDYLGEVAVGSRVDKIHCDGNFAGDVGWMAAGSGRINLIGEELGEALYTKVSFENEVVKLATYSPKHCKLKHSVSSWKFSNCMPTYSYEGYEGKMVPVEIYARGDHFELYQNDNLVKKGKVSKYCINRVKVKYVPGKLEVVVFDKNNKELGRDCLTSAVADELIISLTPELPSIKKDELAYVRISMTDNEGVLRPLQEQELDVEVINGELLSLASANPYNKEGFLTNHVKTFFGEALAIIKPTSSKDITIKVRGGFLASSASIKVSE